MNLSGSSIEVLSDLVVNRLAIMSIGDQDDLREKIALKRALNELKGSEEAMGSTGLPDIPRRGRRRKVGSAESL
ncbi:MAG: hypothetical protein PHE27_00840 [Alphaproteobacteria bacterium]|nr:hypothetical protein [Alphaproteobacteria bacterium]